MDVYEAIMAAPERGFQDYFQEDLLPGLIMEFGVSTGGYINLMASLVKGRTVYGFDSFEGLPEAWHDCPKGQFACDPDKINWAPNVVLVKGLFQNTLGDFFREHNELISLIHIDCDIYSSTKCVFGKSQKRFQTGSIILFDEIYGYGGELWRQHEYKAFNEFLKETGWNWECIGRHGSNQAGFRLID